MRPAIHPLAYISTICVIILSLIVLTNIRQEKINTYNAVENKLRGVEIQLSDLKNEAEKKAKDINRFQQKKYGIEAINPEDTFLP